MFIDTKARTNQIELMDDFSIAGERLRKTLDQIAQINRLLGGNRITLSGVENLIRKIPKSEEITIIDLGCGNGDMLRALSVYADRNGWNFKLIGVDANLSTIEYARELSALYPNITYLSEDIFSERFEHLEYDIALCTLTLHHFKEEELVHLMEVMKRQADIGIVVNDLHRNALAYRLFQLVCFIFRLDEMPKKDGLVSILRGFKRKELIRYSEKLRFKNYTIHWKWAFRYQWVISKI